MERIVGMGGNGGKYWVVGVGGIGEKGGKVGIGGMRGIFWI